MTELPRVCFANSTVEVTRLISGGNPLCGNSHLSPERDAEMQAYFTAEQIVAYFHRLQAQGINALQARGDYHRLLYWLELFKREGGRLHWIAQTASEMADTATNIRVLAAAGAIGIYLHGTKTDNLWLEGRIDTAYDALRHIRDSGVQVGLGTHMPEVIEYAEEKGWDIDFYMACFYNLNREKRESALVARERGDAGAPEYHQGKFLHDDPPRMCAALRATQKMCLAFKILAAGRRCGTQPEVAAAFHFAFANIKPKDAVVVGMFPKHEDQIALNAAHALKACSVAPRFVPRSPS